MQKIRKPELDQYKQIWVTKAGYFLLRKTKKKERKSMARLVDDSIKKQYGGKI